MRIDNQQLSLIPNDAHSPVDPDDAHIQAAVTSIDNDYEEAQVDNVNLLQGQWRLQFFGRKSHSTINNILQIDCAITVYLQYLVTTIRDNNEDE